MDCRYSFDSLKKKLGAFYHNIQQGINLDLWVTLYLNTLFIVQKVDLEVLESFLYLNPILCNVFGKKIDLQL